MVCLPRLKKARHGSVNHASVGRVWAVDHLSVEFVNVGGWSTNGNMALDSGAQFLAVAEHRLIPARVGLLVISCAKLASSPACQDPIPGGHGGVGVISLHGALFKCSFPCYT